MTNYSLCAIYCFHRKDVILTLQNTTAFELAGVNETGLLLKIIYLQIEKVDLILLSKSLPSVWLIYFQNVFILTMK